MIWVFGEVLEGKAEPPAGCVASVMSNQCTVYLQARTHLLGVWLLVCSSSGVAWQREREGERDACASKNLSCKVPNENVSTVEKDRERESSIVDSTYVDAIVAESSKIRVLRMGPQTRCGSPFIPGAEVADIVDLASEAAKHLLGLVLGCIEAKFCK